MYKYKVKKKKINIIAKLSCRFIQVIALTTAVNRRDVSASYTAVFTKKDT